MTTSEPSHRRGQAVDDAIVEAALATIAEQGTLDLRIDDVAARAGVNKTTIYRRYESAEDLAMAAILRSAEAGVPMPDHGDLRQDLDGLVRLVRTAISDPAGQALLRAAGNGPFDPWRRRYWAERLDLAAELFHRAAKRGECGPVPDAVERVEALVAPIHFRILQVAGTADDGFLDAQVERTMAALPRP